MTAMLAKRLRVLSAAMCVLAVAFGLAGRSSATPTTQRVSTGMGGVNANGDSLVGDFSANGRFVAFSSTASNLVSNDTNVGTATNHCGLDANCSDVFLYDLMLGMTERASLAWDGAQANSYSSGGSISSDARYVAFTSLATNLVPGDTNGLCPHSGANFPLCSDVFVRDRQLGTTSRVSVSSAGEQGNDDGFGGAITDDGRYVLFNSWASNLVPNDTNNTVDAFVHDRATGITERVSLATDGSEVGGGTYGSDFSADGRFVVMSSLGNMVPEDTNGTIDVYVRDRQIGTTIRASLSHEGQQLDRGGLNGQVSDDGKAIAFESESAEVVPGLLNELVRVYVRDFNAQTTELISSAPDGNQEEGASFGAAISADGRMVSFASDAPNLVTPALQTIELQVYARDRLARSTRILSVSPTGEPANGYANGTAISKDGALVGFFSPASNLVEGDTGAVDIFVSAPEFPPVAPGVSKVPEGNAANADPNVPKANLWLCAQPAACAGPGEGSLRVVERAENVHTGDENADTIEDGLGAYEFTVEYDNFVIASVDPCDLVFGPGGAGSSRGPVDELDSSDNPDCQPDPGALNNGSCVMSLILENLVHFGCVTGGQSPGPTGDFDLASLELVPHEDLANDLFPGNNNGVLTVVKDNGCELVDVFGHPATGSVNGGLTPECGDLAVTVRILEGDLDLDCDVDVTDAQAIAGHYGAFFGGLLYQKWLDLEPELHDLDIDIKDIQKVFGRVGSTCQAPVPAQPPLDPPVPFG